MSSFSFSLKKGKTTVEREDDEGKVNIKAQVTATLNHARYNIWPAKLRNRIERDFQDFINDRLENSMPSFPQTVWIVAIETETEDGWHRASEEIHAHLHKANKTALDIFMARALYGHQVEFDPDEDREMMLDDQDNVS